LFARKHFICLDKRETSLNQANGLSNAIFPDATFSAVELEVLITRLIDFSPLFRVLDFIVKMLK
jgi:hypothetical protein